MLEKENIVIQETSAQGKKLPSRNIGCTKVSEKRAWTLGEASSFDVTRNKGFTKKNGET